MTRANYHTHTARCRHAQGTDESFVQSAIAEGYQVLGFSDHTPWRYETEFTSGIRMHADELPGYIHSIQSLRRQYADRIRIHLGLEAEYFPRYRDQLLQMMDMGIEYYIMGQHYLDTDESFPYIGVTTRTDDGVLRYADRVVEGIRTGLFQYVAHPDIFMRMRNPEDFTPACEEASRMICQASMEHHMPLEYNLLGLLSELEGHGVGYPSRPFWSAVAAMRPRVILGVDAHNPNHLLNHETLRVARAHLETLGLQILDCLDMDRSPS